MQKDEFALKVAGAAGEGIMSTGEVFSKVCTKSGYNIFDYTEYPSLITGGHNTYQITFGKNEILATAPKIDVLLALNLDALKFHRDQLTSDSIVIYDSQTVKTPISDLSLPSKILDLPAKKLALEAGGKELMANNVELGVAIYLFGLELNTLLEIIAQIFSDKKHEIVEENQKAATAGYNFAKQNQKALATLPRLEKSLSSMTGNEAVALGALSAGLQFYVAYPMTPSSSVLHFLADHAKETGIVVKHAEDEISVANMALGASFAGARTMVGTSGGGFCYMTEALGAAGICELPLVFFLGSRPGPALGMPTWTSQGDLAFALNASHGEFPRIVLAPSDAKEAFDLARKATTLAQTYQIPVILLSDKLLGESRYVADIENEIFENKQFSIEKNPKLEQAGFFPRYKITETGVSPRVLPGTPNGISIINTYEHNEYGFSTEEAQTASSQVEKRALKLTQIEQEIPTQFLEKEGGSKITLVSFGSTKNAVKKARLDLKAKGTATNHLHLSWLWPFPKNQVTDNLTEAQNIIVIEGNHDGQLKKLIAQETGISNTKHLGKYDGRPIEPENIVHYVQNLKLEI